MSYCFNSYFGRNMHKNVLFLTFCFCDVTMMLLRITLNVEKCVTVSLLKNCKNSLPPAAGAFLDSGDWGLRPQTPNGLRRLRDPPPDRFSPVYLVLFVCKNKSKK